MKSAASLLLGIICCAISGPLLAQPGKIADQIAPTLKATIDTAHADWKKDGGAEFKSGVTYVGGVPTLMVITEGSESADKLMRRKRSIVSACEFLLDDGAFAKAMVCVVHRDPKDPKKQAVANFEIRRGNYQEAVKRAAKVTNLKDAAKKAKETDAIVENVCAELGVK